MIFSLVAMTGLEKCFITSAYLQWLCHSGERPVARGPLVLLVMFWKFQHFNLVSKIFRKLFKPLPCHKSTGKMLHAICISAVAVSLRWASCGPWASCFTVKLGFTGAYISFSYFCSSKVGLTHTHNLCFWAEIWKLSEFLSENFHFFWW